MYDIIVIGGGPAGLTAAIYARRANKTVLVLEKATFGGQITFSPKVENIPGFTEVSGNEFADKLVEQALAQGVEFEFCEALEVKDVATKTVVTDSGEFEGKAVIIATGAKHRHLGIEKEEEFIGNGISFCAVCDGAFYQDKHVIVVGGGNSALQEALLLSETSAKVTIVQNLDFLTGEQKLAELAENKENIEIIYGCTVEAYLGGDSLAGLKIKETKTGELRDINADGVFLAIGLAPVNDAFKKVAALDERGYVVADGDCHTSGDGVFVAGDCRAKKIRQIATAVSDGATAALEACSWIDSLKK
jgi:thioredoxin reductase (NADPH)